MTSEVEADLWLAYWHLVDEVTRSGGIWSSRGRRAVEQMHGAQRELDELQRHEARS